MKTYFLWLVFIVYQLLRKVRCDYDKSKSSEHGVSLDGSNFITDHTFIALIDIVFTDGSKRICTGAIVDDTVVITAAHCFTVTGDSHVVPELTLSFVVIGTRKMFETGYEQYLPIERFLTHPDYRGWKSDLSLVFTFAAMTANKPGNVIHLASDKNIDRDTNITLISWGSSIEQPSTTRELDKNPTKKITTEEPCADTDSSSHESTRQSEKDEIDDENIGRAGKENNIDRGQKLVDRGQKQLENKDRYQQRYDATLLRPNPNNDRGRDYDYERDRKLDPESTRIIEANPYDSEDYGARHNYRDTHFDRESKTRQTEKDENNDENIGRTGKENKIDRGQKLVDRGQKQLENKDRYQQRNDATLLRPNPNNDRGRDYDYERDRKLDLESTRIIKANPYESEGDGVRHDYGVTHFDRESKKIDRGQKLVDRGRKQLENKDRYLQRNDATLLRPNPNNDRGRDYDYERDRKLDLDTTRIIEANPYDSEDYGVRHNYGDTHFNRESKPKTIGPSRYLADGQEAVVKRKFHKRLSKSRFDKPAVLSEPSSSSGSTEEFISTTSITEIRHKSSFDAITDVNEENLDKYIDAIYEKSKKSARKVDFETHSIRRRDLNSQINSTKTENTHLKTHYKNSRRRMGHQKNGVFVGLFNMIKLSECKRLMERAVSSVYDISEENDFLCYTSDEHIVSEYDSGAPAVKRNKLVAITLGGFECDGERIALGMKLSCYCPWIASNIPNGKNLTCCRDCCLDKEKPKWMVI